MVATAQVAHDDHICHCLGAASEVEHYSFGTEPFRGTIPGGDGDPSFCWQKSQASTIRKCMASSCSCIASFVPSFLSS